MSDGFWTDDHVARLKQLWTDGYSASQIASMMAAPSRNSILSKVHRLNLESRTTSSPRQPRPPSTPTRAPSPRIPAPPIDEPAPLILADGKRVTVLTAAFSSCRWPYGDPALEDFHFCGHQKRKGSSYCEFHTARAWSGKGRAA